MEIFNYYANVLPPTQATGQMWAEFRITKDVNVTEKWTGYNPEFDTHNRSHPMYFLEQLLILVPTGISMRFSQLLGNLNWGLTIKGCRLISVTKQTLRKEKAYEKGERISKRQQFYLHFINFTKTVGLEKISPVSLFQVIKLSVRSLQEAWALATNFLKV